MEQTPHIAILPSPGMGHLIPFVELAKRLLHHNFHVTCIIPTIGSPPKAMEDILQALPVGIDHVFLPPVSLDDREGVQFGVQISITMNRSVTSIRDVLKSLIASTRLVAFILDPFASDALDVGKELKVSSYFFCPTNAMALSLLLHMPKLDETVPFKFRDLPQPLKLPGCIPILGTDLPSPIQDRTSEYKLFLVHTRRLRLADGIIVNTFMDLEARTIKALEEEEGANLPIYPIGPIIQTGSTNQVDGSTDPCLSWLDNQPSGSVLFVCFGSGGTLSNDQLNELALGLELSGQRFILVVRSPDNESSSAAFLGDQSHENPFGFLPKGFIERTKEKGLVVPSWAPQAQVLSHGSTGGFLTHCGWNSTLESIIQGIPLIAWPLYAEQRMNAVWLTEDLKVALRPKANENGLVERQEIAAIIEVLMVGEEGKRVHNRMKNLKNAAEKALSTNGTSIRALSELALKWKNQTGI